MVQILIPSSTQSDKNGKPFTLFNIEIYLSGKCYTVQRRYSEFYELNKKLKKYSYDKIGNLPPKKLKNLNQKLIEHRRTCLEKYLQNLLRAIGLNNIKELNEFLNLTINETTNIKNLNNQQSKSLFQNNTLFNDNELNDFNFHQSMISFKNDNLFTFDSYDLTTNNLSTTNSIYSSDTNSCSSSNSSTNGSTSSNCSSSLPCSLPDIVVIGSLDAIYK